MYSLLKPGKDSLRIVNAAITRGNVFLIVEYKLLASWGVAREVRSVVALKDFLRKETKNFLFKTRN